MLGVCYYPEHWPEARWAEDARRMREVGISYVRVGEFAWSRIEPRPGEFQWGWLDKALEVLGAAGLKVVLGTPTATPPKWLIDAHPDVLAVDRDGRPRTFGSRRHYCFSSETYAAESRRIVEALARRYGEHAAVAGWQTDNEYGCHDTILSYSENAQRAFRRWLQERYGEIGALNEAWGNVFWSMEYGDFDEIDLPNLTTTEANPSHWLDFHRFSSDQVVRYDRMQVELLRAHSPGRFVLHNFMGMFLDFDHFDVAADLDAAAWDSYPLGFTEQAPLTEAEKMAYARTGHPDMAAFHHDLYRAVGRGRWWVIEQQPGPVNWAPWNPSPAPGMVRLWTWEALAHGAEVVSYFRWRQAPFAQEQMHAGLNRPDFTLDDGGREAEQVARELATLPLPGTAQAPVALVFDYQAAWTLRVQPQGRDFDYFLLCYRWYEALRRFGLDVDFVRPGASLEGYAAAVVPSLPHVSAEAAEAFDAFDGALLFGPRCGSKAESLTIPENLPPGPLQNLLRLKVGRVESLRPGLTVGVAGAIKGKAERWRELVESDLLPLARFADGRGALYEDGRALYLACWPDREALADAMRLLAGRAGLKICDLPEGVRLRRRGDLTFAFNYAATDSAVPAPADAKFALGGRVVGPQEVAAWRL